MPRQKRSTQPAGPSAPPPVAEIGPLVPRTVNELIYGQLKHDIVQGDLAPWQRLRFEMRPGLAGFWRTLDPGDTERIVQLDLHYVQSWSLALDFRLLLQAVGHMLAGRRRRLDLGLPS